MIRSIQLAEQPSRNNNTKKNNDRVFNKKFIIKKADIFCQSKGGKCFYLDTAVLNVQEKLFQCGGVYKNGLFIGLIMQRVDRRW